MSAGPVVAPSGRRRRGRRELGLDRPERAPEQAGLGVGQPVERGGEVELVLQLVEPDGDLAVARAQLVGDRRRRRHRAEQLVGGADDGRQLLGRAGDRLAVVVTARCARPPPAPPNSNADTTIGTTTHTQPGTPRRRRRRRLVRHQPRSSAPSLAVAAVTLARTSATSASVRLRSGACRRRR